MAIVGTFEDVSRRFHGNKDLRLARHRNGKVNVILHRLFSVSISAIAHRAVVLLVFLRARESDRIDEGQALERLLFRGRGVCLAIV